jgi:hypothetical protein
MLLEVMKLTGGERLRGHAAWGFGFVEAEKRGADDCLSEVIRCLSPPRRRSAVVKRKQGGPPA